MRSISRSRSRRQEGSWTWKIVSGVEEDPGLKPLFCASVFRGLKPPAPSGVDLKGGLKFDFSTEMDLVSVNVQPRAVRYWRMRSGVRAEWPGVSSRVTPRWRWTC